MVLVEPPGRGYADVSALDGFEREVRARVLDGVVGAHGVAVVADGLFEQLVALFGEFRPDVSLPMASVRAADNVGIAVWVEVLDVAELACDARGCPAESFGEGDDVSVPRVEESPREVHVQHERGERLFARPWLAVSACWHVSPPRSRLHEAPLSGSWCSVRGGMV